MYRPEGWENPYTKTGETLGMRALYEAGADAMLEGLMEHNQLDHIDVRGIKSKVVFIPEDK